VEHVISILRAEELAKQQTSMKLLLASCIAGSLFFNPEDGGDMFLRKMLIFNGLHSFISQKTELFITTAVKTSNLTQ
jgi:hypothetical protein